MIHVTWYSKGRVILGQVTGDIELNDVADLNDQMIALIDQQGQTPVHLIVDITHMGHTPTHLLKLREASHVLGHKGVGWIVAVGLQNAFMNFLGSMLTQVGHMSRYRVMATVDEAYSYLQTVDDRLPLLQPK